MTAVSASAGGKAPAADPTMEDILASIRRILNEDETAPASGAATVPEAAQTSEGPLILTEEMMVPSTTEAKTTADTLAAAEAPKAASEPMSAADIAALFDEPAPAPATVQPVAQAADVESTPVPMPIPVALPVEMPPEPEPVKTSTAEVSEALLGATAAAAATAAVSQLMRTVAAERSASVYRGGPSIEDVVREEIRPLLKDWLNTNLPPMVERLVRAEIERVVGRSAG
ncbi:DUF2497 domain-containing protein [Acetobacteraceae bacterium H6797]|nr:DUF2497 domain-containing protein [Acetobacteraceae bacterium H6797]